MKPIYFILATPFVLLIMLKVVHKFACWLFPEESLSGGLTVIVMFVSTLLAALWAASDER